MSTNLIILCIDSFLKQVSGAGPQARSAKVVSSDGDGETGTVILDISERLISALVEPTQNQTNKTIQTATVGKTHSSQCRFIFLLGGYQDSLL